MPSKNELNMFKIQNLPIAHTKVVNESNKHLSHHFGGDVGVKRWPQFLNSGTLEVPFSGTWKSALLALIAGTQATLTGSHSTLKAPTDTSRDRLIAEGSFPSTCHPWARLSSPGKLHKFCKRTSNISFYPTTAPRIWTLSIALFTPVLEYRQ